MSKGYASGEGAGVLTTACVCPEESAASGHYDVSTAGLNFADTHQLMS